MNKTLPLMGEREREREREKRGGERERERERERKLLIYLLNHTHLLSTHIRTSPYNLPAISLSIL
jgi:hypothetical protein